VRIKIPVAVILLGIASFVIASKIDSAEKVKPDASASQPSVAAISSPKAVMDLPYCRAFLPADPNTLAEGELRNYIMRCTENLSEIEDYKSLDALIDYLRSNKIRTSSGLWLQSFYYAGFENMIGRARDEAVYDQNDEEFSRWIEGNKSSDAAHLALSMSMISRAWLYRGDGYAGTVSEDAGDKFQAQISKTKKFLLEHKSISERDPEWYSQLFIVLRAANTTDEASYRKYFDEATKRYPDYYPIYFNASVFYLPKWHGDADSFEQFAKYAGKNLSAENANAVYARIYWANVCTRCGDKDVANWREHWPDLRAGFDQVIKDYPDQWNINSYARIACSAYDQDKTLEVMKKISGSPIPNAWDEEQYSYEYCANWSGLGREAE